MGKKRIQLIRETVLHFKDVKKNGFDLQRQYEVNELVYDDSLKRFGRIVSNQNDYLTVRFDHQELTYFRNNHWNKTKEKFLEDNYLTMTNKDFARAFHCSEKIVEKKLSRLNLKRNFEWDEEKDGFLLDNLDKSNKWLAEELDTTLSSIKGRIYRLKMKGYLPENQKRMTHKWTEKDDEFLIKNLGKTNKWLADHFNLKVSTIKSRIRKLRLQGKIKVMRKRGKRKQR